MGVALAAAALGRGADVTLIAGTVAVPLPEEATVVHAESAGAMRDAVLAAIDDADVLVMAAAVADFRPATPRPAKIERGERLVLELEPTPDILAQVARSRPTGPRRGRRPLVVVGFAAETGSLDRAPGKLARKGVDLLVANDVTEEGSGFGSDTNRVTLLARDGTVEAWPRLAKREVAERLLDRVAGLLSVEPETTDPQPMVPTEASR
jgi:phosphopantothenoylcysteine decarboxylase/phosphopantothenate--cysteine ligase